MVTDSTIIHDATIVLRTIVLTVTDPLGSRVSNEKFVLTAYPERKVTYPVITIKCNNSSGKRLGMNTDEMVFTLNFEVRIWARNQKEKDQLTDAVIDKIRLAQHTASTGTIANNIYHLAITSCVNVDEEGDASIKSKILSIVYEYYTD